jgi:hypothetical protein
MHNADFYNDGVGGVKGKEMRIISQEMSAGDSCRLREKTLANTRSD